MFSYFRSTNYRLILRRIFRKLVNIHSPKFILNDESYYCINILLTPPLLSIKEVKYLIINKLNYKHYLQKYYVESYKKPLVTIFTV